MISMPSSDVPKGRTPRGKAKAEEGLQCSAEGSHSITAHKVAPWDGLSQPKRTRGESTVFSTHLGPNKRRHGE